MKIIIALICVLILPLNVCAVEGESDISSQETELEAELERLDFSRAISDISSDATAMLKASANPAQVENEFYYVIILALLCLLSLSIVLAFLTRLKDDVHPKDIMSSAGLILIVFGTIILVLIVDTSEQLTAAIGILGAIAGYLFRSTQEGGRKPAIEEEA